MSGPVAAALYVVAAVLCYAIDWQWLSGVNAAFALDELLMMRKEFS